jgi:starch synthase (maltosyl-transferring)
VRIFRVDNPHTKTFPFWEWLIGEIKRENPEVLFLAEAFTRPKVMYRLAKLGFSQSYTYFTWRNTKQELTQYLDELVGTEVREYFRPNFWPNTPDILPEFLQYGERSAFVIRFVLAATLSSNYGIYGPAFELGVHESLGQGREEYLDSEKFQIRAWDRKAPASLASFIARVNRIRRENPALQSTWNLKFCAAENPAHLCYCKSTPDRGSTILVLVSLDPFQRQAGKITVPLAELGIDPQQPYLVHDLLGDEKYIWQGADNHVTIDPAQLPARIFRVHSRLRRETDFDYFM